MSNAKELNAKVKFGLKSFITVVVILLAVLFVVGILTFVIPAGRYTIYTIDQKFIGHVHCCLGQACGHADLGNGGLGDFNHGVGDTAAYRKGNARLQAIA